MEIKYFIDQEENRVFAEYVFEFFNHHPYLSEGYHFVGVDHIVEADLIYGNHHGSVNKAFYIQPQHLIFSDKVYPNEALFINRYQWGEEDLFSVENTQKSGAFLEGNKFGFDWIEMVFFHLSRYEEFHFPTDERNQWDLMPEQKLLLVLNDLEQRPVVDELVMAVLKAMDIPVRATQFSLCITHDVDHMVNPDSRMRSVLSALKHGHKKRYVFDYTRYFEDFTFLIPIYKIEKVLYLHTGGNHRYDGMKNMDDKGQTLFKKLIKEAKALHYNIGLHPSFLAATNAELFFQEKQKIEEVADVSINRSRQHFLHFDVKKTIGILESAGIDEDSSLGYNEYIGYRCGTAASFFLFDLQHKKASKVKERPMIWMDSAQWAVARRDPDFFMKGAIDFISNLPRIAGVVFNFHSHYWSTYRKYGLDLSLLMDLLVQKTKG